MKKMRKTTAIVCAVGVALLLSIPMLSIAMAAPVGNVIAVVQSTDHEKLDIKVLPPLAARTISDTPETLEAVWYGGAVIPIRILVTDPDGATLEVSNATVTVWINGTVPATSVGMMSTGNTMTHLYGGVYQFNLNTKGLPAGPGAPEVSVLLSASAFEDHVGGVSIGLILH